MSRRERKRLHKRKEKEAIALYKEYRSLKTTKYFWRRTYGDSSFVKLERPKWFGEYKGYFIVNRSFNMSVAEREDLEWLLKKINVTLYYKEKELFFKSYTSPKLNFISEKEYFNLPERLRKYFWASISIWHRDVTIYKVPSIYQNRYFELVIEKHRVKRVPILERKGDSRFIKLHKKLFRSERLYNKYIGKRNFEYDWVYSKHRRRKRGTVKQLLKEGIKNPELFERKVLTY